MSTHRHRWTWTKEMDETLTHAYRGRTRGVTTLLGKKWGFPAYEVRRRARRLGLTRVSEPDWTARETGVIEKLGYLTAETLQEKLFGETGIRRSVSAILEKRRKMQLGGEFEGFSVLQVAEQLDVPRRQVAAWCTEGLLRSSPRNAGSSSETARPLYWISETDLRQFIIDHAERLRLGGVEARWFVSLLVDGGRTGAGLVRRNGSGESRSVVTALKSTIGRDQRIESLADEIAARVMGRVPPYVWTEITERTLESGILPPRPRHEPSDDEEGEEAACARALVALHKVREPLSRLGKEGLQRVLSLVRLRLGGIDRNALMQAA